VAGLELGVPCEIGDYTDFYASIHHATTVGRQFRPEQPLLPNYSWVPIGYHGRASSIVASGQPVRRPVGQTRPPEGQSQPRFGPSARLDYELELGLFVGTPNALGEAVDIRDAESHLFGVTLFNDWSARDLQAWEYQPLGPFLAKNFASTVSPWVVTLEALAPFRARCGGRTTSPRPCPTSATRTTSGMARWTSCWRSGCRPRPCGPPATRGPPVHQQRGRCLLDPGPAADPPHGQRLQPAQRDLLGTGTLSGPTPNRAARCWS
jgi:fumarylacetoacetase